MFSRRVRRIGFSPTLAVNDLARRMQAEGVDLLDLSAGQPDFPTPDEVKTAGKLAIDENRTRYTATDGIVELRRAVARTIERDLGVAYAPDEILVSPGAKSSLLFAFMALLDEGDEALVPLPYWTSYPEQVRLAGGEAVFVPCDEERGFRLDPRRLEAAITPRTRLLILNTPSNPTGACYRREELIPLAEICARRKLWIVADEIYAKLIYDGRSFESVAQLGPEVRERTVLIDGLSKTYSMTGWRIGFAAGPRELIAAMSKLQSQSTSNATSISQWAGVAALELAPESLAARRDEFERRRDAMIAGLRALPGVSCFQPEGAFYAFPRVSGCFGDRNGQSLASGSDLARLLLERARVAVVPGEAFGSPDHVRLSFAVSVERIEEAMRRISAALSGA